MQLKIKTSKVFEPLKDPWRYKVLMGGRGSGKSWAVADFLLAMGAAKPIRVLCTREFQTSIKDSVHKLLTDRINVYGIGWFYTITEAAIRGNNGTEFIFKGLRRNINEIKSTEGIDIAWVEEAQAVSEESWQILTPTVRKPGSEIWIVFNPDSPDDATYKRFVTNKPENCLLIVANYKDNAFFPDVLEVERKHDLEFNADIYDWKWLGQPRVMTDAQVFRNKFEVKDFESVKVDRYFYGADWGFAADPTTLVRCFMRANCLYIDHEAWGVHCDISDTPKLFDGIPDARKWPIKADSARPETISYMRQQGYNISGAKKWAGSVEDGIAYLRSFDRIYIHPRCKHVIEEFKLYGYKVDRNTGDILPVIVDAHNHGIDALRYSLDGYIRSKGEQKAPSVSLGDIGV